MDKVGQIILVYLSKAIAEAGSSEPVTAQTGLLETGLLDSMGLVGLIQFIESEFDLRIPDADMNSELFETPASVAAYVARHLR